MSNTEPNKIIYSMIGVSKSHEKKVVLKDIYLSYFYGAKIGVLGLNGSGKSHAAADPGRRRQELRRADQLSPGYTVGFLEQEPQLDGQDRPADRRRRRGRDGRAARTSSTPSARSSPSRLDDEEMDKLLEKQGELQEKIDHLDAWDLDQQLEMAMDALRCPPARCSDRASSPAARNAASRCAGCCCRSRTS